MGLIQHDSNFDLFNENRDSGNNRRTFFKTKLNHAKGG